MQPSFGYRMVFLPPIFAHRWLRPLDYAINSLRTLFVLTVMRPRVVWLQIAPTPLLYVAMVYKWLLRWNAKIIIDCHNSAFREPFISFPGIRWLMKRSELMLLHNKDHLDEVARRRSACLDRALVLEDRSAGLENMASTSDASPSSRQREPFFLMCCSFDADEPIEAVFAAARKAPDIKLKITGDARRGRRRHDLSNVPPNVELTGFVKVEELDRLITESVGLVCLTTRDTTQLSVCNEAVGAGRPMVLSDTTTLRALFHKGGVFVDPNDPADIATAMHDVVCREPELVREVVELRQERLERWESQAAAVKRQIFGLAQASSAAP